MRQLKISEIKQLENKEPIPSFTGRITKVHEQNTDTGQFGQWWLQGLVVQDETGEGNAPRVRRYVFRTRGTLHFWDVWAMSPMLAIRELVRQHGSRAYQLINVTDVL